MAEHSNKAEAVFVDSTGVERRIVTARFRCETDQDALEIARDIAILEGTELVECDLPKVRLTTESERMLRMKEQRELFSYQGFNSFADHKNWP